MKKLPILILCAGFGKRMLDLTRDKPKPLLKIKNTTLLGNSINFFKDVGCTEIFINTHYLHNKIEKYIIKNFNDHSINLIYEPAILDTGGGVKNIFNYINYDKICVVNSDIFWIDDNKKDIINFFNDTNNITHCKILLSKNHNFYGLKKINGDFKIYKDLVSKWSKGDDVLYYSGIQIVSKKVFQKLSEKFSMNVVWNKLIVDKKLKGSLIPSKIIHIGDKNSFHYL